MPDNSQSAKSDQNTGSQADSQPAKKPSKLALSPSRANDYRQCPLKYRFRAIDKIPEPSTVAQVKGTLVHAVLEEMYSWPREQRTYPAAVKRLKPTWAVMCAEDDQMFDLVPEDDLYDFLVECRGLLKGYFMMENPAGFDAAEMEKFVQLVLDRTKDSSLPVSVPMRGFIDRVDIAPTGEVRIVDYKTGKKPSPRFRDEALFQMRFYALVWWHLTGKIPEQLRLMYLKVADDLVLSPSAAELESFQAEIAGLWQQIVRDGEHGDFVPKKSKLCGWCSFQELCPAYGGTTPEYPGWPGAVGD